MEKPDKPAAPPRLLAYTSSELFTTNREYFRGGSRLNDRPRKTLGWTTSAALFDHHLTRQAAG